MYIFIHSSCLSGYLGSGGSREAASSDEGTDGEERGGEGGRYEGGDEVPRVHPEKEEDQCYDQVYESIASRRRSERRESTFEGRRRTALCLGCAHDARDHRHRYLLLLALSSSEGVRAADDLGTEHHQLQELLAGGKTSLRVHGQLRQRQRRAHLPSPRNSRKYSYRLSSSIF